MKIREQITAVQNQFKSIEKIEFKVLTEWQDPDDDDGTIRTGDGNPGTKQF